MTTKPKPFVARSSLTRALIAVVTVMCIAFTSTAAGAAKPDNNPDKGGNGDTAEVTATINCDNGTALVTSTGHALSNIVIEYANGTTVTITEPFDQLDANGDPIDVFEWAIDLNLTDPDNLVVAVWVKAGNNSERGKKNQGHGEHIPIDATGCLIVDTDGDGITDDQDNCPTVANTDQANNLAHLGITTGDACLYTDFDNNGINDIDYYTNGCIVVWHYGATQPVILHGQHATHPTFCRTTAPTSNAGPNTAISFNLGGASRSAAFAEGGANNTATAINWHADGDTYAYARYGDNNTATATGPGARAIATYGDNNTATATSTSATLLTRAETQWGERNTVTATNCVIELEGESWQTRSCP